MPNTIGTQLINACRNTTASPCLLHDNQSVLDSAGTILRIRRCLVEKIQAFLRLSATWVAAEPLENRELLTANSVTEWNEVLLDAIRAEKPAPPIASRAMAIVHTAIFDAVNSIDRRFEQFLVQVDGGPGASLDAAVASAAQRTLTGLFPAQRSVFDAALTVSLTAVR